MSTGNNGNEEVVDLTNAHLHNLDNVTLASTLKVLDLTANRLTSIDPRILALTGLVSINFRQNLLTDVSAWSGAACSPGMQDCEFRDNQIKDIPDLSKFSALTRLEFSYNEIRSIEPLATLNAPALQELYVAANKVASIQAISQLTALTTLELGSNRIRAIENLGTLTLLRELWLGRNRIARIENLAPLTALRRLSVQSNRLETMAGIEVCTSLEELYLSHNGITNIEGLGSLRNLKMLDLSSNRIATVQGLQALTQLEDLWLNDNAIAAFDEALEAGLAPVTGCLTTLYMENNPAAKDPQYKLRMLALFPKLQQLDSNDVNRG